ncbi:uncharacterized protein LOC120362515 isoform X2 [Saimiri boliviensis]|uniref:uncharacterized protein LOC120362515 isoform X2 n=1 Tax=Saimiri boliviensis TaxID=27679 RepID=UPI003D77545C
MCKEKEICTSNEGQSRQWMNLIRQTREIKVAGAEADGVHRAGTAKGRPFVLRLNNNILQGVCSFMQPNDQVTITDIDIEYSILKTGIFLFSSVLLSYLKKWMDSAYSQKGLLAAVSEKKLSSARQKQALLEV